MSDEFNHQSVKSSKTCKQIWHSDQHTPAVVFVWCKGWVWFRQVPTHAPPTGHPPAPSSRATSPASTAARSNSRLILKWTEMKVALQVQTPSQPVLGGCFLSPQKSVSPHWGVLTVEAEGPGLDQGTVRSLVRGIFAVNFSHRSAMCISIAHACTKWRPGWPGTMTKKWLKPATLSSLCVCVGSCRIALIVAWCEFLAWLAQLSRYFVHVGSLLLRRGADFSWSL